MNTEIKHQIPAFPHLSKTKIPLCQNRFPKGKSAPLPFFPSSWHENIRSSFLNKYRSATAESIPVDFASTAPPNSGTALTKGSLPCCIASPKPQKQNELKFCGYVSSSPILNRSFPSVEESFLIFPKQKTVCHPLWGWQTGMISWCPGPELNRYGW